MFGYFKRNALSTFQQQLWVGHTGELWSDLVKTHSWNRHLEKTGENEGAVSLLWLRACLHTSYRRRAGQGHQSTAAENIFCINSSMSSELSSCCCLFTIVCSQSTVPFTNSRSHVRDSQSSLNPSSVCLFLMEKWSSLSVFLSIATATDLAGQLVSLCSWELALEPNFVELL